MHSHGNHSNSINFILFLEAHCSRNTCVWAGFHQHCVGTGDGGMFTLCCHIWLVHTCTVYHAVHFVAVTIITTHHCAVAVTILIIFMIITTVSPSTYPSPPTITIIIITTTTTAIIIIISHHHLYHYHHPHQSSSTIIFNHHHHRYYHHHFHHHCRCHHCCHCSLSLEAIWLITKTLSFSNSFTFIAELPLSWLWIPVRRFASCSLPWKQSSFLFMPT